MAADASDCSSVAPSVPLAACVVPLVRTCAPRPRRGLPWRALVRLCVPIARLGASPGNLPGAARSRGSRCARVFFPFYLAHRHPRRPRRYSVVSMDTCSLRRYKVVSMDTCSVQRPRLCGGRVGILTQSVTVPFASSSVPKSSCPGVSGGSDSGSVTVEPDSASGSVHERA
jgi:hypothetical protein